MCVCWLRLAHRKEENAVWDQVEAKEACLRRLDESGFPKEMKALAEASERFYELGVYYRNPLEVCMYIPGMYYVRTFTFRSTQQFV